MLALNAAIQRPAPVRRDAALQWRRRCSALPNADVATKQIGAIVKAIQADTWDAVAAMRKARGVVEGAQLSDAVARCRRSTP